jgi:hypothetical protein
VTTTNPHHAIQGHISSAKLLDEKLMKVSSFHVTMLPQKQQLIFAGWHNSSFTLPALATKQLFQIEERHICSIELLHEIGVNLLPRHATMVSHERQFSPSV